ncbi:site-specific integrase [Phocaeicola vulgatus]|uniref:site-specific integrase n=1 Tax=Bacteroidaceae TaxID=815 RepID=UPI00189A58F2|nr:MULTISPECIES: site-specific integrase [Bacteroidaceae]MCE8745142.1 site-specific integrase [Bacteroides ovatus]MDB1083835.1 site-specific integrase [Phocaeicola vulgatus]MDB1092691.1 site-specific integrase [Phocaeicola vulgatus]
MRTKTDFAARVTRFFTEYLAHERNVSLNTVLSYKLTISLFSKYMRDQRNVCIDKLTLAGFTRENVNAFLDWLQTTTGNSNSTINLRLAALHSFARYLQYEEIDRLQQWQLILAIKKRKDEKKPPAYLLVDGIKAILRQPDRDTRQGRRHLALLSLMYDTGARVQEIIDLKVECLQIKYEPFTIKIMGKGRKTRIVPMLPKQVAILRAYMEENGLDRINAKQEHLFFNARKQPLTRAGITYILKTYADAARKEHPSLIPDVISCHSMRHSKAMHMLQSGVELIYIRDILGHVSIQTTDIYARTDTKAKREALEKAYTPMTDGSVNITAEWQDNPDLLEWLHSYGRNM